MKGKFILFVDDEPWSTEPLRLKLEARGFVCDVARDMSSAMKALQIKKYSLVVTDIMMPAGDSYPDVDSSKTGLVFVSKVKELYTDIQIICLSVIGDQNIINSLKKNGVLYLRKGETSLSVAANLIESKMKGYSSF